ncbi:MAG: peptidyl-prolyl cis-trans isomerase [Candidatus Poribacteria bacterium]|nr:peptidyl-prolyl cis-trans isomerase [Candidatus Poribacteria bacterium]
MKKILFMSVTILVICFCSWQLVFSHGDDVHHEVADEVDESMVIIAEYSWNGEQFSISLADLNAKIEDLSSYRQRKLRPRESKVEFLTELIEDELKILAAAEKRYDEDPEHVAQAEDYMHQLMVEKISEVEVDEKINVTDEELMQYYEEHKSESTYIEEAQCKATCISVTDKELAQTTLEEIKAGKDIVEAAKELADKNKLKGPGSGTRSPGSTGYFTKDIAPSWQPFIDAVFAQEVGDMSDSILEIEVEGTTYYLIFRKEEYKPERQKEFDEVRDRIKRKIEREKKQERIKVWIEEITAASNLKTFPELIPEPPADEADQQEDGGSSEETSENAESTESDQQ